jgi:hypothetical protein
MEAAATRERKRLTPADPGGGIWRPTVSPTEAGRGVQDLC